jgi:hypothetical protein
MKTTAWLVYRARDGSLRVNTRVPRLAWDEISWRVVINIPDPWGRMAGNVEITLPESPPADIVVTDIAQPSGGNGA